MDHVLKRCPVVIETPVAWGQMDAFRHLNNTAYFRFFESGRIAYFERLNLLEYMEETDVGPILAATNCRFKIPLTYPDTVSIATRVSEMADDRFTMEYYVVSQKHEKVAAEGTGLIVCFNYRDNRKTSIPEELKRRIEALESSAADNTDLKSGFNL
jgi:acyl-CoA thioester hydrolase